MSHGADLEWARSGNGEHSQRKPLAHRSPLSSLLGATFATCVPRVLGGSTTATNRVLLIRSVTRFIASVSLRILRTCIKRAISAEPCLKRRIYGTKFEPCTAHHL